ncbi:efflux RND transporter periplasmic adaptor subunit [Desulfuribacillus alkaliarsenatis]|uniref:YbhG-like alpha-helical hairpin domain-containing protein n=1 Tax=Desulfuribacillus alkaliarsenatis TaxID=766136 RepID=A0A1E5G4D2_9FIRM|nr:HlyD family efflux transporter periplasmic adaptor subunit [Desulfuribacillus alkaliarsenatis]OEF97519.1 hypothetical protein BHF68_04755 [Desulfuribacillus alkaliarsenatis]
MTLQNHQIKRNKFIVVLFSFILLGLLSACSPEAAPVIEKQGKPVRVQQAEEQERAVTLSYTGIVEIDEVTRLGFKNSGKINKLYVEEDQFIRRNQLIAELDTREIDFAIRDAEAQIQAAQAQYDKAVRGAAAEEINQARLRLQQAIDAYEYTKDQQERISALYDAGAVPRQELDAINLELDIRENEVKQAEEFVAQVERGADVEDLQYLQTQLERAQVDYEHKLQMRTDAELRATIDGYILDVLFKEGEVIGAGQPLVVVRNQQKVITVGVPQRDLDSISVGMQASVTINQQASTWEVSSISTIPDNTTRLYPVTLQKIKGQESASASVSPQDSASANNDRLLLGALATVTFTIENSTGVWVPIHVIMADDTDFIYVVNQQRAQRRDVIIEEFTASEARINGIDAGERIIIEGMRRLTDGDEILVLN